MQAEIVRTGSSGLLRLRGQDAAGEVSAAAPLLRVGIADQNNVLARYVGGDASVLSGLMRSADDIKTSAFAIDIPDAYNGKGRVILFSNNPSTAGRTTASST